MPFNLNSHQGEYPQRPLEASVRLAVARLGRLPSPLPALAERGHASGAGVRLVANNLNPRPWYYAIQRAGPIIFREFTCIIFNESRSTWTRPNLGDNSVVGSSGIFQFENSTWLAHSGFHFPVWRATPREQAIGALNLERVDGFAPWTTSSLC